MGLLDDYAQLLTNERQKQKIKGLLGLADTVTGADQIRGIPADPRNWSIDDTAKMLNFAGGGIGSIKAIKPTKYQLAHFEAQKAASLPIEQGGLGLPPDNTAMDRAKAMGGIDVFHGTASDIEKISKSKYGSSTGANTAKQAFWGVDSPSTAEGYAHYAANNSPVDALMKEADKYESLAQKTNGAMSEKYWNKYDETLAKAEDLESQFYNDPSNGQNIMPLVLIPKKQSVMDAAGAEYVDLENGVSDFLKASKKDGSDLAVIQNLADDVGFNGRPANHYAVLDPSIIRSRFAAFNPLKRNSSDLLASGLLGSVGLNYMIQDERQ